MTDDELRLALSVTLRMEGPDSASLPELAEMALDKLRESQARVAELESKLARAVGECAKSKDDLRRLEVETEWREGCILVGGRELHIRMRGDLFIYGIDNAGRSDYES